MDVKTNSGEGPHKKEESQRESVYCLREYISHHEQNSGGNMRIKGEISVEMKNLLLVTGGKVILVIKGQRTWLTCALKFCGRQKW